MSPERRLDALQLLIAAFEVIRFAGEACKISTIVMPVSNELTGNDVHRVVHVNQRLEKACGRNPLLAARHPDWLLRRISEPVWLLNKEVRTESCNAVIAVRDEKVAQVSARVRRERFDLLKVPELGDECSIDVGPLFALDLRLPFAQMRRANPEATVYPRVLEPLRAAVEERVLAGGSSKAFLEDNEAWTVLRPHLVEPATDGGKEHTELLATFPNAVH